MTFAKTVDSANVTLGKEQGGTLGETHIERLQEPGTFVEVATEVLSLSTEEADYLAAIPAAVSEGMRAGIVHAMGQGLRVQIAFSPAYDFGVKLYQYDDAFVAHVEGPRVADIQTAT